MEFHDSSGSTVNHAYVNPSPSQAAGITSAVQLNNEAGRLERMGDLNSAEKKYLEALGIKTRVMGEKSTGVALTKNGLGELYMTMGKLNDAQKMLEDAAAIRSGEYPIQIEMKC
jgi:tetratricopeptide (TPR) repeat protein